MKLDSTIEERAFDEAAIGMTITGLDGRFQRVNLRFAQMVGRERHELVGVAVRAITHPDDADDDIDALARMAAGEQDFYRAEKRYVRPDGSIVWTQLEVTLVHEDGGRGTSCRR